ncbi:MAG: glucose-6-phosphate dehydrogenase [Trueperaceae bacterium]
MSDPIEPHPSSFVIFGVTGDLAARKLVPALHALQSSGSLHPETVVLGFGRSELSDDALRQRLGEALAEQLDGPLDDAWHHLSERIHYLRGGYDEPDAYARLAERLHDVGHGDHIYYTATPPQTYGDIVSGLADAGLAEEAEGYRRLVIEKPFGEDLDSARSLNALVLERFKETQVYRIDHYLAKETAQNLAVLRFANTLFEPIWSNRAIDHVQITMAEPMGMEGRGSFYDEAGVVRDVFQNHMLQLLALVTMEPPARYDADAVRDEKVKVLRALSCADPETAVLGQYTAGRSAPAYVDEPGVAPESRTPTYAAARFELHNWRWAGVPFYLRAGKRLEAKASEIVLTFRRPPHVPFDLPAPPRADRLILRLVPDEGISLRFNAKHPGQGIELDRVGLDFAYQGKYQRPNPDAYETLIQDVIEGDATLFMRADEVEVQWKVIAPLLAATDAKRPLPYAAGSMGPVEAAELLERDGRHWYRPRRA